MREGWKWREEQNIYKSPTPTAICRQIRSVHICNHSAPFPRRMSFESSVRSVFECAQWLDRLFFSLVLFFYLSPSLFMFSFLRFRMVWGASSAWSDLVQVRLCFSSSQYNPTYTQPTSYLHRTQYMRRHKGLPRLTPFALECTNGDIKRQKLFPWLACDFQSCSFLDPPPLEPCRFKSSSQPGWK